MRVLLHQLLLAVMLALVTGCDPGVLAYKPASPSEEMALHEAQSGIYPDDVRQQPARFKDTMVAWAGVVISSSVIEHADNNEIQLQLEHHYYSWEEIYFPTWKETIFLSPRGEGRFITSWVVAKGESVDNLKNSFATGNLVLVYGYPEHVNTDNTITVKTHLLRVIDKQRYKYETLEYGRDYHFSH